MRVLIAGCGYVGRALGLELQAAGHKVSALRRSPEALKELATLGFEALEADLTQPSTLAPLRRDWDWVVQCTAPSKPDVDTYQTAYRQSVSTLLAWLDRSALRRFLFTSSTSVYGQNDGSWITEESTAAPDAPNARILVEAEGEVLEAAASGWPACVLRVAGIYGPDRNRIAALQRGEAIPGDRAHYVNMIQRDDVAGAMRAVLEHGKVGGIYNASDGTPVLRGEFLAWLAVRLGVDLPEPGKFRTSAGSRLGGHKRISNARLRAELGWEPKYPNYREGYEALCRAGTESA